MLLALGQLCNISLASLFAECQDSVCKQSGHVPVLTWRKLLSRCPRCLTPEVNPDIDTRSQGQWHSLQPRATQTGPYHCYGIITPCTANNARPHGKTTPPGLIWELNFIWYSYHSRDISISDLIWHYYHYIFQWWPIKHSQIIVPQKSFLIV